MLEKILIVAKTRMKSGVCVGGLTASSNRSVRLIPKDRQKQRNYPVDTAMDIGQVWSVDFYDSTDIDPPHTEDIIVTDARYKGQTTSLQKALIQRVHPWNGSLDVLFDRNLTINVNSGKCYISKGGPIPNCSTGYWLPDKMLILHRQENGKLYYVVNHSFKMDGRTYEKSFSIPFVGYSVPANRILSGTLMRVSLARWLLSGNEERCYLQISGCYG